MRYAFWPGCVSRAGTPELYPAATRVAEHIGMELIELEQANCTGAGVLGERNEELVDTLNARNFALAEMMGLDTLLTICSTCQGVMSGVNYKLREKPEYLAKINESLAEEGLEYKGTVRVTHMMWAVVEELGLDDLKEMVVRPLNGLKIAPFYGCYNPAASLRAGHERGSTRIVISTWSTSSRRWAGSLSITRASCGAAVSRS